MAGHGAASDGEYFGAPPQQAMQRRAHDLWRVVRNDPRFSSHGRAVGLTSPESGPAELQAAMARLVGICPVDGAPSNIAAARIQELEALGLKTDTYVSWRGGEDSLAAAHALLAERALPGDLTMQFIDQDTTGDMLTALDALTASCEVLLPMGTFLRGIEKPAVVLSANDASGRAVGAAAAIAQNHPDHPRAGLAYWGMLATAPDWRGEGIALLLGAMALMEMRLRHGFEWFTTGIREGNAPSEALCAKLSFRPSDERDIIAIYPPAFGGDQLTK